MSENPDTNEKRKSINRRRFVQAVGTTGVSVAGLSNVAAASSDDKELASSDPLSEKDRKKTIEDIQANKNAKKIIKEFQGRGWSPKFNEGVYKLVNPDKKPSYRGAVVPFKKSGRDEKRGNESQKEQAILMWTSESDIDNEQPRAVGHEFDQRKSVGLSSNDFKHDIYTVESSDIHTETEYLSDYPDVSSAGKGVTTQDYPDPSDCNCVFLDQYCGDFNWTCLGATALAAGACIKSLTLLCLSTSLGSQILLYADQEGCDICDSYNYEYKSVCDSPLYSC